MQKSHQILLATIASVALLLGVILIASAGSQGSANFLARDDVRARPTFPLFKQTDPRWADMPLGKGPHTIGEWGCLLTSIAMYFNGYNLSIPGFSGTTPINLDLWLLFNNGFDTDGQSFLFPSIQEQFGFVYLGTTKNTTGLQDALEDITKFVILHVQNGHHYVLATGTYNDTGVDINDPYYNQTQYAWTDIVDYVVYENNNAARDKLISS